MNKIIKIVIVIVAPILLVSILIRFYLDVATTAQSASDDLIPELCLYIDTTPNYELLREAEASIPPQESPTREAFLARNCAVAKDYHRRKEEYDKKEERLYKEWCAVQNPSHMSFEDYKSCK